MTKRTASLFPTKSPAGLSLATDIAGFLRARGGVEVCVFNRNATPVSMQEVATKCLIDDLVVFDATREENANNFDIATEMLSLMPNVVIVSRNYLPINFFGFTNDCYPSYLEGSKTNNAIFQSITRKLENIFSYRSAIEKTMTVIHNGLHIETNSLRRLKSDLAGAFVSFRSKYQASSALDFPKHYRFSVCDLAQRIKDGNYGKSRNTTFLATFLETGSLVYDDELLTEHRRWQLLKEIDAQYIRDAQEFWIYGAPDHFDSWWTVGEFASFLNCVQRLGQRKRLRIYHPENDTVSDIEADKLPRLSSEETVHLDHRLMLTNPTMVATNGGLVRASRRFWSLGQNKVARPFMKVLAYPAYRYALKQTDALPDNMAFREYFELMASKRYHDDIVGRGRSKHYWEQIEILEEHPPVEGRNQKFGLCEDFRKLFDFVGYRRIPVSLNALDSGALISQDVTYKFKAEKPRYLFSLSYRGRDFSATGNNLEKIPVMRFVASTQ